jgi:acetylornithine deacetylase
MGRSDLDTGIVGETRLAEQLQAQLRKLGVDAERVGEGDRQSLVADLRAHDPDAETVLIASHLDTVPVDGMEIPPFDPKIEAGRLHGRGSCDTKAGMACLIAALEQVLSRGVLRRNVIVVGEADEELSSIGVRDVVSALGGRRPDWVLATEPTELAIVHAHKGVVHARLEATGRACHASEPELGRNAIVALARATVALDDLAARLAERPDPALGPATLSIGRVEGGHAPNIVPDRAGLIADRRLLPGESVADVEAEIVEALTRAGVAEAVRLVSCRLEKPPLGTPEDHPAVRGCADALRAADWPARTTGVAFGTDAGVFEAEVGVAGVVMGPGSIRRAHTAREYVEIDQVEAMTAFFAALLGGA